MIDLHAHILPGLDDGPPSLEGAVAMARTAWAGGTRAMATTSHIDTTFALEPGQLAAARAELAEVLEREGIDLELLAGGEIAPARLSELDDDALRAVALGGGPYVLLECPFTPVGGTMELMVADLHRRGFEVLLGHPERSPTFQREPDRLARLVDMGALAQVSAGSLTGEFGGVPRAAAERMLERGLLHVLASDGHSAVHRSPVLRSPALDEERTAWMADAVPAAIVAGAPVPPPPPAAPRRARLLRRAWSRR